ncbi:MAG: hypothetical protein A3J81_05405 [Nitrospirae bacterium RIFOXYB2_FULL_43_5]|nr:MAG: hypothetical protein A2484_08910 [Nitrospirae bacterium RIFOXYC2_FULL_44_7]OGW73503.1 MAG: hypothetical protein A3J81_05405 [Nitrospirae bacterium RIFOXYB2_FULL_43_5]HBG93228.1 hypothetical protein [Nitrospiraceae bacterium]
MKRLFLITFLLTFLSVLTHANKALSQPHQHEWMEKAPYGDYCPGYKRKWYGAKITVKTAEEAKKILQEYFSKDEVKIGLISERRWFFRAEILDKNDALVDVVIIDKRTGRMRSIY